jgi:hypothetical protein
VTAWIGSYSDHIRRATGADGPVNRVDRGDTAMHVTSDASLSRRAAAVTCVFGHTTRRTSNRFSENQVGSKSAQLRGSPSTRSPMTFSWISVVPPPMSDAGVERYE